MYVSHAFRTIITHLLKLESNVLGKLTSDRDNDTAAALKFVDIHNTFPAEFFEVKTISFIEIS